MRAGRVVDIYLWTCIDQTTKLMPSFLIGKRSADNARRFMQDIAGRLVFPNAHASDAHSYMVGGYKPITQISTDCFAAYPEAVDLAFGPYVKFGTIKKVYRNASMIYTPSEMVGSLRRPRRGMNDNEAGSICTSHVERLNGTQRLFLKRLNRLTLCFSKKLRNLALSRRERELHASVLQTPSQNANRTCTALSSRRGIGWASINGRPPAMHSCQGGIAPSV